LFRSIAGCLAFGRYTVKTPGGRDSFDCTLLRWPGSGMPTFSILKSEPGNDSQFFTALLVLNAEFLILNF